MATHAKPLLNHLQRLLGQANADLDDDASLLRRFVSLREETAFAALLARHGPMVLGVCRRILRDDHEAEDAFQAVFLLLARKGSSLRHPETLAAWLYGTARRLALTAVRSNRRRQHHENALAASALARNTDPLDELSARELLLILDEEMDRLPERYRLPLILCGIEGRSQLEAARLLGWTPDSVRGRLERGRARLRAQLVRRGLTVGASLLAMESMTTASLSAALRQATVQKALTFAAGSAEGIATSVLGLAESGLTSMAVAKVKVGLALLLTVLLAVGTGALVFLVPTEKPTEATQAEMAQAAQPETAKRAQTDRYGDPLPPGALMRLGTLRFRVPMPFFGQDYQDLPDRRTKLVYSQGIIRWHDAETWKEIDRWDVPPGLKLNCVSPDGNRALLPTDKGLQLWETNSRKCIQTFDNKSKYKNDFVQISGYFPPDGKTIVTVHGTNYNPNVVRVWDVASGKELWHEGVLGGSWLDSICPLGFQEGGRTLMVRRTEDNTISLRDLWTGKEKRSFSTMPRNDFRSISVSPDGRTVMIGTAGQTVRSWDIASGKENPPLGGHKGQAHTFAFSKDGTSVVTGGEDSFVQVWDWPSGRLRRRIDFGSEHLGTIRFTPDGQRLEVLMFAQRAVRYWDVKTGQELPAAVDGHRGSVHGLAFLPSGKVISTGTDNTVRVWDPISGRTLRQFPTHFFWFGASTMSLSADGKILAGADHNLPDIELLDVETGRHLRTLKTAFNSCTCVTFSPAGKYLASTSSNQHQSQDRRTTVQLWDVATGQEVRRISDDHCGRHTFSPDGQFLAVNHRDNVGIWKVATGERYRSISVKDPGGHAYSPDGRMLATASKNGITFWEVATATERLRVKPPDEGGWSQFLHFSPDGRYLATAGGIDKPICLWDMRTGELIHRFAGHESSPESLAFSANGRVLASGSFDTTILLWDVAAITEKRRLPVAKLSAKAIEAHWDTLAGTDTAAAYRSIWALAASPSETVAFLRQRLGRVEPVKENVVAKLVLGLDSPDFAIREHASEELSKLGSLAEPALREALNGQPSLETRRRVQQLLEQLASPPSSAQLQTVRAVEVLEHIGTPGARDVLEALAGGAAEARSTKEAKASLRRLMSQSSPKP